MSAKRIHRRSVYRIDCEDLISSRSRGLLYALCSLDARENAPAFRKGTMMKKLSILSMTVLALLAFGGCKKETTTSETSTTTDNSATSVSASDTAPTATSASDTASTVTPSSTGPTSTTSTGSSGGTVSSLNDADKQSVMKIGEAGLAEVKLGQQISSVATSPTVKQFADQMVSDHSKANDELAQLATNKGVTLPTAADKKDKDLSDKLSRESG